MNKLEIYNWSNLPRNIILQIGRYTSKYFIKEVRLINNHWSNCINSLLFYSIYNIVNVDKTIVNKYLKFARCSDLYNFYNLEFYQKVSEYGKLRKIVGCLDGDADYIELLANLMNNYKAIKSLTFVDDDDNIGYIHELKWKGLIDILINYQDLEALFINIRCTYLLPLFNSLPLFFINKLELKVDFNQVEDSIKIIKQIDRLKLLNLEIRNIFSGEDSTEFYKLIVPSVLICNTLEDFKIVILYYNGNQIESFKQHLNSEYINIFSSPSFKNLKSFDFSFKYCNSDIYREVFIEPLSLISLQWTNLTKLTLTSIDKFLMRYIIDNFPNLCQLSFRSPLISPHNHNSDSIRPLKYLKILLFGGFQPNLIDYSDFIKFLFPNVVTLSPYRLDYNAQNIELDPFYITILFPNLTKLIFEYKQCNLDKLVNNLEMNLKWEVLFIQLNASNKVVWKQILSKLENLKILYVSNLSLNCTYNDLIINSKNFKIFKACIDDENGLDIEIKN